MQNEQTGREEVCRPVAHQRSVRFNYLTEDVQYGHRVARRGIAEQQ